MEERESPVVQGGGRISIEQCEQDDLSVKIPGLDACAACVAGKSVHLPHKGRGQAGEYFKWVSINIARPMPVASAKAREHVYAVVDDYTRRVYTRRLRPKSEAVEAFKVFRAAAENESGKRNWEVMTDNTCIDG